MTDHRGQVSHLSSSLQNPISTKPMPDPIGLNEPSQTSLHFCASKNNLSTARKLLSHGASARIMDRRGQLPLHRAAAIGSVPFLNLLLEHKSPINASDIAGFTALHHGTLFPSSSAVYVQLSKNFSSQQKNFHRPH